METFKSFLAEQDISKDDINVVILTKIKSKKLELVSNRIFSVCQEKGIECHIVYTSEAWISKNDFEKGSLTVSNIDGDGKQIEFDIFKTVCFVRAGVLDNEVGLAILSTFQNAGAFMINDRDGMLICDNKMSSYIAFERDNIPVPRTALVSNEKSVEDAHKKIGGNFPVIIKTITGTQGIGVSIVNNYQSMISVIQSLWKFKAELLIQEYLKFDSDIRTVVMNGKILASTKRTRPENDFRSNRHRGATTEPYELSQEEKDVVLAAARSVGAYIVGVDHAVVNKKIFILECNGSAGIGNNYGLYDIDNKQETDKNDYIGKVTPKDIIGKMIDHVSYSNNRRHSFAVESGYVEKVEIDGYGSVRAKFDTGNGTKASMLMVDNIDVSGKTVKWQKGDKKFTSKLLGISKPEHVGKIDERPIVNVNISFNNKLYKNVPVGLSTKDSRSEFLVNRDLMTRFRVSVNPNRRFALSDWVDRGDETDHDL